MVTRRHPHRLHLRDGIDGNSTIHVISRDGTGDTVAVAQSTDVGHPELQDWSQDGESLLFTAYERRTGLWTVRLDGTGRRFLSGDRSDYGGGAVYSPDGRSLVFQADLDGGCIYRAMPTQPTSSGSPRAVRTAST